MQLVLEGKLVRILDGRQWELWTPGGYAGLGVTLRAFEGQEVRVTIETGGEEMVQVIEAPPVETAKKNGAGKKKTVPSSSRRKAKGK